MFWVRGHDGHHDNEKADRLANAAARARRKPDIPERPRHPVRRDATARTRTAAVSSDDGLTGLQTGNPVSDIARADALERFELGEGEYTEPSLAVLMGERMAEQP